MESRLLHGDALAVLKDLPDACVDAVITDPPYSSGGMFRSDRTQSVHTKYVNGDSQAGNALASFSGDSRDQRAYAYWCALWLGESLRIAKPGAVMAMFTDWRQLPSTTDALQAGGWIWRGIVPWHKPNGRRSQGRFANNCEYVVWGTNGARALDFIAGGLDGFYQISTPHDREHITQKPITLMRALVQIAPPRGIVLDPFMGAGTTGVAAKLEGREFIGIELTEQFYTIASERIAAVGDGYRPRGGQLAIELPAPEEAPPAHSRRDITTITIPGAPPCPSLPAPQDSTSSASP